MDIAIRLATPDDFRQTEEITRDAFWDVYRPGCVEHLLLHTLRLVPAFVGELDFVARASGRIVGSIVSSRARVLGQDGTEHEVLCLGPLSVQPSWQKQGIASALIRRTLSEARDLGFQGVVLFGSPAFYPRFGFVAARTFGIRTSDGSDFDAFMALELRDGALAGVQGRFHEDPAFNVDADAADAFDRDFPAREKHVLDTQLFH